MAKKQEPQGTRWGHHTYLDFRTCPRLYFIKHVFEGGWENPAGSQAMSQGTLGHAWLHGFHSKDSVKAAEKAVAEALEQERQRSAVLSDPTVVEEIRENLERLAQNYPEKHKQWIKENGRLVFVQFEQVESMTVKTDQGEAPYTVRRDAVADWKQERFVFETKISMLTTERMMDMHCTGGQVSGYVCIDQEKHIKGKKCSGALLNHWRPLKTPQLERKPVLRPPSIIEAWKDGLVRTYNKIMACDPTDHKTWEQHMDQCVTMTGVCPMRDVCLAGNMLKWEKSTEYLKTFYRQKEAVDDAQTPALARAA